MKIQFQKTIQILLMCVLIAYGIVCFAEKIKIENRYYGYVKDSLLVDFIRDDLVDLASNSTDKIYSFDASPDLTDLFFYLGRNSTGKLASLHSSNRFKFEDNIFPDFIISANGVRYANINKINTPILKTGKALNLRAADKYISINNKSGNWLGAECTTTDDCFQWLSDIGNLKIYLKNPNNYYEVHFKIACGPDWYDNQLFFQVNDEKHKIITKCGEKKEVAIPIFIEKNITDASIIISGNKNGIRQVSISDLYIE